MVVGGGGVGRAAIDAYEVWEDFQEWRFEPSEERGKDLIEWRVGRVKGGFL